MGYETRLVLEELNLVQNLRSQVVQLLFKSESSVKRIDSAIFLIFRNVLTVKLMSPNKSQATDNAFVIMIS